MTWFGATKTQERGAEPSKAPPSLEFPVSVSARGIAPANAILEHVSVSECRFRTVVLFDTGDGVEFAFGGQQGGTSYVRGSIVSRKANGPRFVYQMRLDRMSSKEIDELARTINENHRRSAAARSHEQALRTLPSTADRLTRSSIRVVTQFTVVYRTPKEPYRQGKAGDVSSGGLLITCGSVLAEGTPVELRFTLPSDVLRVYPEETVALDVRNATVTYSRTDPRRPFAEMVLAARVVSAQVVGNGTHRYGLAFSGIDAYSQEEIARYTHAVQRSRNRH
jgi:hypothetical protein